MVTVDGIQYEDNEPKPDLGSLVNCGSGSERKYKGLEADFSKLLTVAQWPKYKGQLATGSMAMAMDSNAFRKYEATTDRWY